MLSKETVINDRFPDIILRLILLSVCVRLLMLKNLKESEVIIIMRVVKREIVIADSMKTSVSAL